MIVRNRVAVASAALTYASFAMPIAMLGVIWPEVRTDFDQSLGTLGLVALIYGVARMSTATVGRRAVARMGMGPAFMTALALLAAACAALAASSSWGVFLVAVGGIGMTSGLLDSIGAVFVTTIGDIGSAGLVHGFYGLGSTIGPLVVAVVPGWRWAVLTAALLVAAALLLATRVRAKWPPARIDEPVAPGAGAVPRRVVIASLGVFGALVAVEVTTGQWSHTYLTDARGVGDGWAAIGVSGFWGGLMVGRLLLSRSSVAGAVHRLGVLRLVGASAVAIAATSLLPTVAAIVSLAAAGLALGPVIPTLFATTEARVGVHRAPQIAGWQLLATNLGAITVPAATGALVDGFGPETVIVVVLATIAFVAFPLLVVLGPRS